MRSARAHWCPGSNRRSATSTTPISAWEEFRRQRNADGSTSSVWEKWLALSSDPPYLSIYARYDPGMIVRRHGHHSPHVVFVLEGELWVGDTRCPPGTHIELPFGAAFGPLRGGDAGAILFEVMMGDPARGAINQRRSTPCSPSTGSRPSRSRRWRRHHPSCCGSWSARQRAVAPLTLARAARDGQRTPRVEAPRDRRLGVTAGSRPRGPRHW